MKKMKKYYGKFWIKTVAMVLCLFSVIGIAGSGTGLVICGSKTKEDMRDLVYRDIVDGYSYLIMQSLANGEDPKQVEELENTNLEYAVVKSYKKDGADFSDPENYLAGEPMEDYEYMKFAGKMGQLYSSGSFNTKSLLSVLTGNIYINEADMDRAAARIMDFIYSKEDGILYAQTDVGYFPLDEFDVYRKMSANADEKEYSDHTETEEMQEGLKEINPDEVQEETRSNLEEINKQKTKENVQNKQKVKEEAYEEENYEQDSDDFLYFVKFSYEASENGGTQRGMDMYRPDVKELNLDYLRDSIYIYFKDEVLYWNKDELIDYCGVSTLAGVHTHFGDSIWPVKIVNRINKDRVFAYDSMGNNSEANRGWVYYEEEIYDDPYYWVVAKYVDRGEHDLLNKASRWIDLVYGMQNVYGLFLVLFLIVFAAGFLYLLRAAGIQGEEEQLSLTVWHKIPWGIYTCGVIGIEGVIGAVFAGWLEYGTRYESEEFWLLTMAPIVMGFVFFAILYCMNMSVRIKSGEFLKHIILYYVFTPIKRGFGCLRKNFSLLRKTIIGCLRKNFSLLRKTIIGLVTGFFAELLLVLFVLDICGVYEIGYLTFLYVLAYLVRAAFILFIVWQMQKLQEGSRRIAAGRLDEPIDTSKMFWEFKQHGENINRAGDGINAAVQERMKSEHFKTELITNVSHDIKTPLTSIINYVDLIKKQELTDETMIEYVDVLDRQSARLKKLIEDLMEASKASTGNLTVNLECMDITVMLTQVVGEFEERLRERELELIVNSPHPPVNVRVDGRHLWRILDNLLNNICKYAQAGTRVYINLTRQGGIAEIVFRNISAYQLNISSEELMERFVRGDSSRNTEGSGLGLSIAQSLAELMHGTMELSVDGDLFKVILHVPLEG